MTRKVLAIAWRISSLKWEWVSTSSAVLMADGDKQFSSSIRGPEDAMLVGYQ